MNILKEVLLGINQPRDNSEPHQFTPRKIFEISRRNAIISNVLKKWEQGLLDWEESLKTMIELMESEIKLLAAKPVMQEIIKKEAFLPIPVLEVSLMPKLKESQIPLTRQQLLIQACCILDGIYGSYVILIVESKSFSSQFPIPDHHKVNKGN